MQHLKLSFISLLMVIMIKTAGAAVFMAGDKDALPSCQNPYLLEQVKKHIQDYQEEHPYKNIIEYRQQKLLLKNLSGFRQIASQDFDIDENILQIKKNIQHQHSVLYFDKSKFCKKTIVIFSKISYDNKRAKISFFLKGSDFNG